MPMTGPIGGGGLWLLLLCPILTAAVVGAAMLGLFRWAARSQEHEALPSRDKPEMVDPIAILRERFALGEMELSEFERRLDGLLRSERPSPTDLGNPRI